jgi:hypothetical protein
MRTLSFAAAVAAFVIAGSSAMAQDRPTILITGYWPPTNEMVRPWSPTNTLPGGLPGSGWVGENWEGRGFDVVSYFPEFPNGFGRGSGWLEVDYQDTAADFEEITTTHRPVAIITFSRANTSVGWEMEPATQRFRLPGEANPPGRSIPTYTPDYSTVASGERYPTNVPIATEPVGTIRNSTLPMQQIVNNVSAQMTSAQASPFIPAYNPATPDTFDYGGAYLSGYIGYLGSWYQARNQPGETMDPCYAAGHIHVGQNMTVANGTLATEITLRTLIGHLNSLGPIPAPGASGLAAIGLAALMARPRRMREQG